MSRGSVQSTLVRVTVAYGPVPRGSLGVVADQKGASYWIRWLDPLPDGQAHEAAGSNNSCWVREEHLQGVGMVVLEVPDGPAPGEESRLWLPGR